MRLHQAGVARRAPGADDRFSGVVSGMARGHLPRSALRLRRRGPRRESWEASSGRQQCGRGLWARLAGVRLSGARATKVRTESGRTRSTPRWRIRPSTRAWRSDLLLDKLSVLLSHGLVHDALRLRRAGTVQRAPGGDDGSLGGHARNGARSSPTRHASTTTSGPRLRAGSCGPLSAPRLVHFIPLGVYT